MVSNVAAGAATVGANIQKKRKGQPVTQLWLLLRRLLSARLPEN
jgi:hypothetical protein